MIRPARVLSCALLGLFGAVIAQACSASASRDGSAGSGAVAGDAGTDLGDGSQELQPNATGGTGGMSPYNPMCGVNAVSDCVPDDELACDSYLPPGGSGGAPTGETGGGAGTDASAGQSGGSSEGGNAGEAASGGAPGVGPSAEGGSQSAGDGGQGGRAGQGGNGAIDGPDPTGAGGAEGGEGGRAGSPDNGGGQSGEGGGPVTAEGGTSGQSSTPGSGGMSGGGGEAGGANVSEYACRVVTAPGGGIQARCAAAGPGGEDAPCFSSADCAPGLACTGDSEAGQCRHFCCEGDSGCRQGTHCAERSLLGVVVARQMVPVCVPAVDCSLAEPFPCPAGVTCSCPDGEACMVVRDDGTTTCVKPGSGAAGEPCPCASGHICSQATNQCVKLCQTAAMPSECGSGRCQASAELPSGFGVCVGATGSDAD
jgi:hypothetical protein